MLKVSYFLLLLFLIPVIFQGCKKDDNNGNGDIMEPRIEWITGGAEIGYEYQNSVVSGYYFHRRFKVLGDDGQVFLNISVNGDELNMVSKVINVIKGKEHTIRIQGNITGGREEKAEGINCFTIVFSALNCHEDYELHVSSFAAPIGNGEAWFCPKNISLGEIQIFE